jgi:hypothetical protein
MFRCWGRTFIANLVALAFSPPTLFAKNRGKGGGTLLFIELMNRHRLRLVTKFKVWLFALLHCRLPPSAHNAEGWGTPPCRAPGDCRFLTSFGMTIWLGCVRHDRLAPFPGRMGYRFAGRRTAFLPVHARSFAALAAAQDDVKLLENLFKATFAFSFPRHYK